MGTARMTVRIAPPAGQRRRLGQRLDEALVLPDGDAAADEPASDAQQRDADRQDQEGREEQRRRQTGPTEAHRPARPGSARPDARVAGPAARRVLHQEQERSSTARGRGERRGRRSVEGRAVLLEDRGREGVEAEHREGTVLGEQVQPDQQRPAEDRQSQLGQDHADGDASRVATEARADLLEGRVEAAQRGHDRQVDERVVGQGRDQDTRRQTVKRRHDADPAIADDERRDDKGRREQDRQSAPTGHVGALDDPRRHDPDRRAGGHGQDEQRDRVHEQLEDPRTERQLDERGQARLQAEDDDVGERDQRDGGDGDRRDEQRGRKMRRWRACRSDHA